MKNLLIISSCILLLCSCYHHDEPFIEDNDKIGIYTISSEDQSSLVIIPNVIDNSEDLALLKLQNEQICTIIEFVPDEFHGPAVALKHQDVFVKAGDSIPKGDTVTLFIGNGYGTVSLDDPLMYYEYMAFLDQSE